MRRQIALFACILLMAIVVAHAAPAWSPQTSGVTATLRGVSAASDRVAWASGSGSTLLRTADGGITWTKLAPPSADRLDFRDIDAIDERTAYLLSIGSGTLSRIFKTIDAGAHWETLYTNQDPKAFFDAMAFSDRDHGIVIGDSVDGRFSILLTEDGGKTWTPPPAAGLPTALPNEGAFAASGTNVAFFGRDNIWFGTGAAEKARVLHSHDRGRTWTVAETPIVAGRSAGIFSVAFRDSEHGVVVGGDYTKEKEAIDNIAVTSDGGKTWTLVKDHPLSGFRSAVAYAPRTRTPSLIAVGPQGADWSTDDGRTWTPIAGPGFHSFSFSKTGTVGWGAGGRGSIAKLEHLK